MEFNRCYKCMEELAAYPCPACGYEPGSNKQKFALRPGTILNGRYLVGTLLGQGGFGITYIGWDLSLERKVAIKEYFPAAHVNRQIETGILDWYTSEQAQIARKDGREMFLKEARKMTRVSGIPQVVQILDLFQGNETAYIVMEFIEGQTLKQKLQREGTLSWEAARKLFLPVLESLDKIHNAGLIHRDLSPDNLMIQPDGSVKILDLGAAKDLNLNSGASSMVVAKSGFSPLEQYVQRGNSGSWSDVYSIAATMYYSLTGTLPPTAIERMDNDTINWELPQLQPLHPSALWAMKRALAVRQGDRIQTMREFAGELEMEPRSRKKKEAAKKTEKYTKPKKKGKLLIALVNLLCVVALAFIAMNAKNAPVALYQDAEELVAQGKYREALEIYISLKDYRESLQRVEELTQIVAYEDGEALQEESRFAEAAITFGCLGDYEDSRQRSLELWEQALVSQTIAAGVRHTAALKNDGSVAAVGDNGSGRCDSTGWQEIVSVCTGDDHTVGLKADGTVVAIGDNRYGQCEVSQWTDIVAISAGDDHTVGLKLDGTVVVAGANWSNQCDVESWTDIIAVSAGRFCTVGLKADGTVVAVGLDEDGQCQVSGWSDIVAISAGNGFTLGLKDNGTVMAVGNNDYGQCSLSAWRDIIAISAGANHTLGLKADGTVVSAGSNEQGQCDVADLTEIAAICAGGNHTLALKQDGTVTVLGRNNDGECNLSAWTGIALPE